MAKRTFIVAVEVEGDTVGDMDKIDLCHVVHGMLREPTARVRDVTVWDCLGDLLQDRAEGLLEPWVAPAVAGQDDASAPALALTAGVPTAMDRLAAVVPALFPKGRER